MKITDRTGHRYERLIVTARAPNAGPKDTNARWYCRCDCGRQSIAYGQDLARGKVKSCGCLNASRIYKHGMARTPIHRVWISMRHRCENKFNASYHNYGGRGIFVCDEWQDFAQFYADMGQCPDGHTLERIDNNGPYSKANCRWATGVEQHNNKRTNRFVTAFGKTQTIAQWSAEFGVPWTTIRMRIEKLGWTNEQSVSEPKRQGRKLE